MTNTRYAMIIDDNPANVLVLVKFLSIEGITSTSLSEPLKIHTMLDKMVVVPSIVFIDLEMPGMGGFEVLQLMRSRLGYRVPIVAYTIHTSEVAAIKERGFDSMISKPLDRDSFSTDLWKILRGEKVWGSY